MRDIPTIEEVIDTFHDVMEVPAPVNEAVVQQETRAAARLVAEWKHLALEVIHAVKKNEAMLGMEPIQCLQTLVDSKRLAQQALTFTGEITPKRGPTPAEYHTNLRRRVLDASNRRLGCNDAGDAVQKRDESDAAFAKRKAKEGTSEMFKHLLAQAKKHAEQPDQGPTCKACGFTGKHHSECEEQEW